MWAVRESFQRAKHADFARAFYVHLLAADSTIERLFAKTHFESQHALLVHGIYSMLDFYEGKELGRMAITRLAKIHGPGALNVTPDLFDQWMRSFFVTMAVADPEWTPALAKNWEKALRPAIDALKAPYFNAPGH